MGSANYVAACCCQWSNSTWRCQHADSVPQTKLTTRCWLAALHSLSRLQWLLLLLLCYVDRLLASCCTFRCLAAHAPAAQQRHEVGLRLRVTMLLLRWRRLARCCCCLRRLGRLLLHRMRLRLQLRLLVGLLGTCLRVLSQDACLLQVCSSGVQQRVERACAERAHQAGGRPLVLLRVWALQGGALWPLAWGASLCFAPWSLLLGVLML